MTLWRRRLAACLARLRAPGLALLAMAGALVGLDRVFPPPLERAETVSQWVTDRHGQPLRAFPTKAGRWRFPADLDGIDPVFIEALLAVEDKRFHRHGGVDWAAMVRALVNSARAGRIVSGGSTITMQSARLLEPRPRTVSSKLVEMVRAYQIEARLSKREILELYLTLAPYGGNLEGVRAASWRYFGHAPDRLSDAQVALLIALPQAPEARRPDRAPEGARSGRARIAKRLHEAGLLDETRLGEVQAAALPGVRQPLPSLAWHAAAEARRGAGQGDVRTTLDRPLQAELERLLAGRAERAGPGVQLSALVVHVPTRSVRVHIGSAIRARPGGWIDMTDRPRSPGSTLKPFIYGLAFDDGLARPTTRIGDLPRRFDAYQPENFDRSFRGDVTVAEALQHSLNVPAVLTLAEVGTRRFAAHLALAGATPGVRLGARNEAGLALALGGAGMTAQDLARLYAALGDGGRVRALRWKESSARGAVQGDNRDASSGGYRLMSPDSARTLRRILAAAPTPAGRMPGHLTASGPQIAFKTGTSYGFRDAWAAGLSGDHAIVVWVGRADGAPRPGETGRKAALPVLFEIADRVAGHLGGREGAGARVTRSASPASRHAMRRFGGSEAPPEILFPPANAQLWAGGSDRSSTREFVLSGRGEGRLDWYVDSQPCGRDDGGMPVWRPATAGYYKVSAVDAKGRATHVRVRVIGAPPA